MPDQFALALKYRALGIQPCPFRKNSKKPAFRKGEIFDYRNRRLTDAEVRKLFAGRDLNIGAFTGFGHVTLDVDGDEGRQSIKGLAMPPTPMVETSPGRYHAHFRTTEPLPTRIRPLPGIDILADDWQVLMPPSTHPDGSIYRCIPQLSFTDVDLAHVTAWIRELCHTPVVAPTSVLPLPSVSQVASKLKEEEKAYWLSGAHTRVALDVPQSLDALGGWPALLRDGGINERCMGYFGLMVARIGSKLVCPLPGHPKDHKAVSLYWDDHKDTKFPSGMLKLRDWHYATGERTYNQPDLLASRHYHEAVHLRGPEIVVWQLRLLLMLGIIEPYPVGLRALPKEAPRSAVQLSEGYRMLVQGRWLLSPGERMPFSWKFAKAWCGMRSTADVVEGMQYLLRGQHLLKAGTFTPEGGGRPLAMFLPGNLYEVS